MEDIVRIERLERLLQELHSGPPLPFLEDAFSLTEFAQSKIAAVRVDGGADTADPID